MSPFVKQTCLSNGGIRETNLVMVRKEAVFILNFCFEENKSSCDLKGERKKKKRKEKKHRDCSPEIMKSYYIILFSS